MELEMFGIASSLHVCCNCGLSTAAGAELVKGKEENISRVKVGTIYCNRVNSTEFSINQKLLLAFQLSGSGRTKVKIIPGMLDLAQNRMAHRVTDIQRSLGVAILQIGKEVLLKNLQSEKSLSPIGFEGKSSIFVSNDARWDKRSAGHWYDSLSGCSIMIGNRSGLVIGLKPMSQVCIACQKHVRYHPDFCSHNYEGSSKGMEATGASRLVRRLYEEGSVYLGEYVSDTYPFDRRPHRGWVKNSRGMAQVKEWCKETRQWAPTSQTSVNPFQSRQRT
jgi:hypothetical protein